MERRFYHSITDCQIGDLVPIEDPLNPYGESNNVVALVKKVYGRGGLVILDSTLAPHILRNPWDLRVGIVVHSGTKYLGGHSDLLSGVCLCQRYKPSCRNENGAYDHGYYTRKFGKVSFASIIA